jgi:hypothetical protein
LNLVQNTDVMLLVGGNTYYLRRSLFVSFELSWRSSPAN